MTFPALDSRPSTLDSPQGWCSDAEAAALQELAANRDVVEVGVWKGRSTVALARVARQVIAVDWFRGDAFTGPANTLAEAVANLDRYGARDRVVLCVGDFRVVLPVLDLSRIGLAYYDADHTLESTATALQLLAARLGTDVPIAVHDYQPGAPVWSGVVQAVDTFAARSGRVVQIVDRLAILRHRACPGGSTASALRAPDAVQ